MLPPSSIQNSAGSTSSPRTTQELANALTVDKATQITIKQVSVSSSSGNSSNQSTTATLVVQLGSQQYLLKTQQQPGQTLSAQAQAIITRTEDGKILLDFLQQSVTPTKPSQPSEQSSKTGTSITEQTVRNNQPPSIQAKVTTQSTANTAQQQTTSAQRNTPIQVNLGQPRSAPLTINRPISGQSIQVVPQHLSGTATSLQANTTTTQTTTPPASSGSNTAPSLSAQPTTAITQQVSSPTNNLPTSAQQSALPSGTAQSVSTPTTQAQSPQAQSPQPPTGQINKAATPATTTSNSSTPAQHSRSPGTNQHASSQSGTQATSSPQTVQLLTQPSAALSKQLPLHRPVIVSIEQATQQANGSQTLQVKLENQSLQLQSPVPINVNDKAVLLRTSGTQAVLQTISPDVQSKETQKVISETLREVLPNQQPLANVLNQLHQIGKQNNKPENSNLNRLLSSLMSLYSVPSEGGKEASQSVQRNLQDGGLFSERQLLNNKPPTQDLKAQLGQLLNAADSLPEQPRQQMLDLIKSLLNRVTQNQLESLQQNRTNPDGSLERLFTLDLPVRQGQQLDNVELKINEYRREISEQEWQSSWKVRLHFDLGQQGTIDAEILLEQENEVTAQFWCSHSSTTNLLNEKLSGFNQHLQNQGFHINNLNCHTGKTPTAKNQVQQLIDINT